MKSAVCALIFLSAVGFAAEEEKVEDPKTTEGQDFENEFM